MDQRSQRGVACEGVSASLQPRAHDTTDLSFMLSLNYTTHAYLSILLARSSSLLADPSAVHPELKHVGQVGQLADIHLFSVPRATWDHSSAAIIGALRQIDGVLKVDIQEPRMRAKRDQLDF
jgi:hypothetical protein